MTACREHGLTDCAQCGIRAVRAAMTPTRPADPDTYPTRAAALRRARTERANAKETQP